MKGKNLFYFCLIIFLAMVSCRFEKAKKELHSGIQIGLSPDSTSIQLKNIPLPVIEALNSDSMTKKQWQSLFAVYPQGIDPELTNLQSPMDGEYILMRDVISFLPAEGFEKGQSYLVEYYAEKVILTQQEIIQTHRLPYKNKPYSILISF